MDLAPTFRYRNPDGSCVHCTTVMLLHWQGLHNEATTWKGKYRRGEYASRHQGRMDAEGLRYAMTTDADERLLEWGINSRRYCGVVWNGPHFVNLVGKVNRNGRPHAVILDNNAIHKFIYQPWPEFIANWRRSGGWAVVILSGAPPPPTPRHYPAKYCP